MKILVGIDGSDYSFEALRYAISEAKIKNARLTAILFRIGLEKKKVFDNRQSGEVKMIGKEAMRDEKVIEKVEKMLRKENVKSDTHVFISWFSPGIDLVRYAEENGYDHIVVGSKGSSGITRVQLGSVAEEVVRKAHCPVTVFRK